jgi:hypothetical protein
MPMRFLNTGAKLSLEELTRSGHRTFGEDAPGRNKFDAGRTIFALFAHRLAHVVFAIGLATGKEPVTTRLCDRVTSSNDRRSGRLPGCDCVAQLHGGLLRAAHVAYGVVKTKIVIV